MVAGAALRVITVALDVCDREAAFKALREIDQLYPIDLLVANAGVNEETLKSFDVKTTSHTILESVCFVCGVHVNQCTHSIGRGLQPTFWVLSTRWIRFWLALLPARSVPFWVSLEIDPTVRYPRAAILCWLPPLPVLPRTRLPRRTTLLRWPFAVTARACGPSCCARAWV